MQTKLSIAATGTTEARQSFAPFGLYVCTDPAGSEIRVEFSDDLVTWYTLCDRVGGEYVLQTRFSDVVNITGGLYWRLNCTLYGGTPFTVLAAGG